MIDGLTSMELQAINEMYKKNYIHKFEYEKLIFTFLRIRVFLLKINC